MEAHAAHAAQQYRMANAVRRTCVFVVAVINRLLQERQKQRERPAIVQVYRAAVFCPCRTTPCTAVTTATILYYSGTNLYYPPVQRSVENSSLNSSLVAIVNFHVVFILLTTWKQCGMLWILSAVLKGFNETCTISKHATSMQHLFSTYHNIASLFCEINSLQKPTHISIYSLCSKIRESFS